MSFYDKVEGSVKTYIITTSKTAFPYKFLITISKEITFKSKINLETFRKFVTSQPDTLYFKIKLLAYFIITENS